MIGDRDPNGNLFAIIMCVFVVALVLFASCAPVEDSATPKSLFTFRDMDDGTSILSYKGCSNCKVDGVFVINWETRTICEGTSGDIECWTSIEKGVTE